MSFYVNCTLAGERLKFGPMDAELALKKALELRDGGYALITLTDLGSGAELDIERFMVGNPSATQ